MKYLGTGLDKSVRRLRGGRMEIVRVRAEDVQGWYDISCQQVDRKVCFRYTLIARKDVHAWIV